MTNIDKYCQLQEIITSGGNCPAAGKENDCEGCILHNIPELNVSCKNESKGHKVKIARSLLAHVQSDMQLTGAV